MLGMYRQDRSTGKGSKANSQKGIIVIVTLVREGTFSWLSLLAAGPMDSDLFFCQPRYFSELHTLSGAYLVTFH